jgi:hypothetical protein
MNKAEAIALLEQELAGFRDEPYEELVSRIPAASLAFERVGPSGAKYQLETQVFWDDPRGRQVRVMGFIDDGGWRAYIPLTRDFIKAPDGSFLGE